MPERHLRLRERALPHVERDRRAHLPRELESVRIDVRDHHVAGSRVPYDGRRHQPDRAGARDQHVLAEDRELQRGVHRVAEWVEDRRNVSVDRRLVVPDVRHRQRDELGERAGPVHADPGGVVAEVAPACHAVPASAAHDVSLAADEVAGAEVAHVRPDVHDLADELVPDHEGNRHRLLGPLVPFLDVEVGAADPRAIDADQDVVDPDLGLGDLSHDEPRGWVLLHEGAHPAAISARHG
jgi:hypothetical protein